MAVGLIGAVQVPLYPTSSEAHIRYIFNDAAISASVVNDALIWERIKQVTSGISSVKQVIFVEDAEGLTSLHDILLKYHSYYHEKRVTAIAQTIQPDNLFSIIYTSGSTGRPKGVMLSHRNLAGNFPALTEILKQSPARRAVSALPLCPICERILNYMYQN